MELHLALKIDSRYEIIAFQRIGDGVEGIVLVHLPDNDATPLVSWRVNCATGVCHYGDYYHSRDVAEALGHWRDRCAGRPPRIAPLAVPGEAVNG